MRKITKIIIKKRSDDYLAYLEEYPAKWDQGKTPSMAIGNLIITYKKELGIEIEECINV